MAAKKLKILLVGDYPNDARLGSAKVLHKLREEFQELGHDCHALFSEEIGKRPRQPHLSQAFRPVVAAAAIAGAFRQRGPFDVVDIASAEGFVFGLQRRLGKYGDAVFVSRSNGLEHLNYKRMLDDHREGILTKPWTRRIWYPAVRLTQVAGAARLADRLIVLNEADRAYALGRGWQPSSRISIIPHGISSRFLKNGETNSAARGAGILFCGTWDNAKGISYLVEAYSLLIERGVQSRLTVLGGGVPKEKIIAQFPAHARAHVSVLDRAPEAEVMSHYRNHDLLVFCSTYEGYGMVLAEAMSQGLPVISTPVGCATALVKDGETGVLVPPRNSEALADAIQNLWESAETRKRLAENAVKRVSGLTWRNTASETLQLYELACEERFGRERRSTNNQVADGWHHN